MELKANIPPSEGLDTSHAVNSINGIESELVPLGRNSFPSQNSINGIERKILPIAVSMGGEFQRIPLMELKDTGLYQGVRQARHHGGIPLMELKEDGGEAR